MRQRLLYSLFFLAVFLIALLAKLPAALVLSWAGPLPGGVSLYGVGGTIWDGRAEQVTAAGESLGALQWRLSPWSLPLGRADLVFRLNRDNEYLLGELRWSGMAMWHLSGLDGELQLARLWPRLKRQVPQLAALPIQVEGRLRFFLDELALDDDGPRAHGRINWLGAAAGAPEPLPLGDLSLQLNGREGTFADAGGPLSLQGTLELNGEGGYAVEMKLAARDSAAPMLGQALAFLGAPDALGRYHFQSAGRLGRN